MAGRGGDPHGKDPAEITSTELRRYQFRGEAPLAKSASAVPSGNQIKKFQ
jgi:hypothetical protein